MTQSQGTAPVAISSFSQKIRSSAQIQQSHSGNSRMQSITRFIGHNRRKGKGKPKASKLDRGKLIQDLDSCMTDYKQLWGGFCFCFFLPSLWKSPIFQGIFICKSGRALVSRLREVCFFIFSQEDALRQWSHLTKLSRDLPLWRLPAAIRQSTFQTAVRQDLKTNFPTDKQQWHMLYFISSSFWMGRIRCMATTLPPNSNRAVR